jgi:hypothetical protein
MLKRTAGKGTLFVAFQFKSALIVLALVTLVWTLPGLGQNPQVTAGTDQQPGSITGTVVDQSGALVAGARVNLTRGNDTNKDQSTQEAVSGADGRFSFANIAPGAFQLTISSAGFAQQTSSGVLRAGEVYTVPQIALVIAPNVTDVEVALSRVEVAEAQIKDEEKQRVLGVIPNFYVTYDPHPVSLTAKQKFELAWKTSVDPVTFVIVGGIAGVQQAQNTFGGYGQGAQGYAKRYGASYADLASGTFIGSAILPSLLKQDPRYFYKGVGSKRSRILYAIANAVICKGDNGHWQPNYSNILGNLAAGGISNLYYPSQNRNGAGLTFQNAAIGIGATAAANLVEEFLMRKLTPNLKHEPAKP